MFTPRTAGLKDIAPKQGFYTVSVSQDYSSKQGRKGVGGQDVQSRFRGWVLPLVIRARQLVAYASSDTYRYITMVETGRKVRVL